jgi:multidrug efflux pump subunit AcrA (membrane-fusion protein)|tara:strand:- start:7142 stop:8122 length:981 start_codon:yes stop_codon:yes gene_type:complete
MLKKTFEKFLVALNRIPSFFRNIELRAVTDLFKISDTMAIKKSLLVSWIIMIFTILIVTWAGLSEIDQVVVANGIVTPESEVHFIQSAVTGPVEKINVNLGDKIVKGELIFLIANTQHYESHRTTLLEVEARKRKVAILQDLFDKGAESEIRLIDEKLLLLDAERRLALAKTALDYSEVKSSVSGTVSKVHAKNIGVVVNTGANLAEIVPDDSNLRLNAMVQTKDIPYVTPNQKAKISFLSFDMAIYGQFDGTVKTVSASTTVFGEDPTPYYEAIIEVDKEEIKRLNNIEIQSGMHASVSIIGKERTILSYLFNPITKLSKTALRE